ncbi:hypothetical protein HYR54_08105 [Candidatus Acetothermia bacterium]|nr:hypothetical protein [Candidatus Acetothermia bacterium]
MASKNRNAEWLLSLVALAAGGAAPILMLLSATTYVMVRGLPPAPDMMAMMMNLIMMAHKAMALYLPWVLIPSLIILGLVILYSSTQFPRLFNRIWAGLAAGFVASFALDAIRYPVGVGMETLPGDLPTMFGMMITGTMPATAGVIFIGYVYHFLNGASFGLIYTLIAGKVKWYWGLAWGLIVELLMMTTPPMLVMGVGPFGINPPWWPKLFLTTLAAHVAFGVILGLLAQRWVKEESTLFHLFTRPAESRTAYTG